MDVLVNQIVFEEPLISETRKPQLRRLVYKLIEKLETNEADDFYLFKASDQTKWYDRGKIASVGLLTTFGWRANSSSSGGGWSW